MSKPKKASQPKRKVPAALAKARETLAKVSENAALDALCT